MLRCPYLAGRRYPQRGLRHQASGSFELGFLDLEPNARINAAAMQIRKPTTLATIAI
jgi:hypothetical protein